MASSSRQGSPRRAVWGLLDRRERWSLSSRGWSIIALAFLLSGTLCLRGLYPFLAVTHRVDTDVLVVEGWIHQYAIHAAAEEFRNNPYRRIFTTGGPVVGTGRYINDFYTSASVGADLLKRAGIPEQSLRIVPSRVMDRDRTYSSAIAFRDWLREHEPSVNGINVLTEDAHARRTRLLFSEALGDHIKVGIISVANPDYDAPHWWRYSEGVRDVIGETIAYIYARFFFGHFARSQRAFLR